MFDPAKMFEKMKQINEIQQQFQEDMRKKEVHGSAGGGMVKVTMNGHYEISDIQIDGSVLEMKDKGFLQDLIRSAVNEAGYQVREMAAEASKSWISKLST